MSKISQKLYSALTASGITPGAARHIAESVEFLGDSTEASRERDERDITLVAHALSSLVKRHVDTTPIIPKEEDDDVQNSEMTRVGTVVKAKPSAEETFIKKPRRHSPIIMSVRRRPIGTQKFLVHFLPCVWVFLMILLAVCSAFAALAALCAIICVSAGGTVLFLAGMLYGVSQFSVFVGGAFFELGISLIIAALSVLFSVLLFNFLTRGVPFFLKTGMRSLVKINSEFTALRAALRARRDA